MKYLPLIGRILFSLIFIFSGISHVMGMGADFAASKGIPMADIATRLGGLMIILGGLSVALGYKSNIGTMLLMVWLLLTAFMMHNFWIETDPMANQMGMAMFMKNIALLGATILIHVNGTGDMSLDNRAE